MGDWTSEAHACGYLERADGIPHRREGEAALLEQLPRAVDRVLDLGSGDGRLLSLVLSERRDASGVALDYSPPMLAALRSRFAMSPAVEIVEHDLATPLPSLGRFTAVVSSFAIHHLPHERKRALYAEVHGVLEPGGVFCNLEHVSSPTPALHERFLHALGLDAEGEDASNELLDVETQLGWLRELGYRDVDCLWKWRELALLVGWRDGR